MGFKEWNGGSAVSVEGRVVRGIALLFICLLTFGSYFVYDTPGALQSSLQQYYKVDVFSYSLLYSVYSWPNTIQVFVGGFIVDRWLGVRLGVLVFGSLILAGQLIWAVSSTFKSFPLAILGRVIFGLGGETLSVCQSTFTARWFKGKELALAFGIALSFSRVGSAANFQIEPFVEKASGIPAALWFGVACCVASVVCAVLLASLDKYAEKRRKEPFQAEVEEPPRLTDVRHFPATLWIIFFICVTFYVAVFVFIQFGSKFLQQRYGLTQEEASPIISTPYIVSAIASPFLGFGVDFTGRSLIWIVIATGMLMMSHFAFYILPPAPLNANVLCVSIGIAYSVCAAALWPTVAFAVDEQMLGTAYGLMTAIQNLGIAVSSLGVGYLLQVTDEDYPVMEYVFGLCAAASCLLALALVYLDSQSGGRLNSSAAQLKEIAAAEKRQAADKLAAKKATIQADAKSNDLATEDAPLLKQ